MTGDKLQINLKAARARAGLSLAQTSELTGVSKAMLGQIERGESSPTLATLWKIAKGFHLPLTAFLEDMVLTAGSFTPAPARADRTDPEVGMHTVFAFDPRFGSETFIMTLPPGHSHETPSHDSGVVEDVFVIRGEMEVLTGGTWTVLHSGDGLRFAADQPHGYRNRTGEVAQFHNTIHYPRRTVEQNGD